MSTSQFFGLNIGYTGLQAANAALNVTGNNISNVETKGYTRQEATQVAADALRTNTSYGMAGAGVDTKSIDQIRNEYYDLKYWQNNANKGIYEIKQQYYRQIEDYFTDTDDVMGFNAVFSDMFDALDEVYKSAGDDTRKASFLSQCKSLTEYFNNMHTSLQNLQIDVNNEIQNKVNEINSIASEIATLNKQINTIEVNHVKANELRDKRNLLIDQLSNIVDVKVTEIPIFTTEGGTEESGIYRYIVDIAGGQNLVNSYEYSSLECVARNGDQKVNQSDADGLYDIYLTGLPLNLYGGSLGGQLKGLIEMRDGNNGENFSAKGKWVTTPSDYTVQVEIDPSNPNYDFLTDMNKVTMNSAGTIVVGNKELVYDSWQYKVDQTTGVKTYTFHLNEDAVSYPNNKATGLAGKDISMGVSIDYQGIPYYMAQMNEWVRGFAQAMNRIERTAQTDASGTKAESMFACGSDEELFNRFDYSQKAGVVFDVDATTGATLDTVTFSAIKDTASHGFQSVDNYLQLTAGNFTVNSKMIRDVSLFGTTSDYMQGQDAQDITNLLLEVRTDKSKMTYRGCSSEEFLQCLTSDVALGASSANNFYSNFDKISKAIVAQRTSISGVDNDEEALNLVKFQEAYNLSSKMIQVMTEIYDRLILQTGV